MKVRITEAGLKRAEQLQAQGRCLGCEEKIQPGQVVTCGQCPGCYQASRRNIDKRRVTRSELIREGKMLAPKPPGRKPTNKLAKELSER